VTKFEPRNEAGLSKLTDEDLLAYIAAARARGEGDHLQRGLAVIVFRYFDDIVRRCRIKVPPQDAEDVASEAMTSAIRSSLEGQTVGEFRAWLNKIVARRIADYHRKQRVDTAPLPEEHAESDEIWGQAGITDDETGVVEVEDAIARILDKLSDAHRRVVEFFVLEVASAEETAEQVNDEFPDLNPPMSIDNVSQIARRFRKQLRDELGGADDPPEGGPP